MIDRYGVSAANPLPDPSLSKGRENGGDWAIFTRTIRQKETARRLRREATGPERLLWSRLSRRKLADLRFRRQHPMGPYFLDFYCPEIALCIELDGEQHGQSRGLRHDAKRDAFLSAQGVTILRFWNHEVRTHLRDVLDTIYQRASELKQQQSLTARFPSPWKGEGQGGDWSCESLQPENPENPSNASGRSAQ